MAAIIAIDAARPSRPDPAYDRLLEHCADQFLRLMQDEPDELHLTRDEREEVERVLARHGLRLKA